MKMLLVTILLIGCESTTVPAIHHATDCAAIEYKNQGAAKWIGFTEDQIYIADKRQTKF